jgi:hypothetical protein
VQVHRFSITFHRPYGVDVARMAIDEPGDYVVQWWWRGYYDCQDIRVIPQQPKDTPFPYGKVLKDVESKLTRIDHCQFSRRRIRTSAVKHTRIQMLVSRIAIDP